MMGKYLTCKKGNNRSFKPGLVFLEDIALLGYTYYRRWEEEGEEGCPSSTQEWGRQVKTRKIPQLLLLFLILRRNLRVLTRGMNALCFLLRRKPRTLVRGLHSKRDECVRLISANRIYER